MALGRSVAGRSRPPGRRPFAGGYWYPDAGSDHSAPMSRPWRPDQALDLDVIGRPDGECLM